MGEEGVVGAGNGGVGPENPAESCITSGAGGDRVPEVLPRPDLPWGLGFGSWFGSGFRPGFGSGGNRSKILERSGRGSAPD